MGRQYTAAGASLPHDGPVCEIGERGLGILELHFGLLKWAEMLLAEAFRQYLGQAGDMSNHLNPCDLYRYGPSSLFIDEYLDILDDSAKYVEFKIPK